MLIFCLILKESHPVSVLGRLQSETSAGPLAAGLTGEPQTRLSGTVRPPARSCQTPPTNGLPQQVRHSFVAYHKAAHHLVCDANCRGSPRRRVPPRRAAAAATASAAVRGAGHTTRPIPQRASTPSQSHPPPPPPLSCQLRWSVPRALFFLPSDDRRSTLARIVGGRRPRVLFSRCWRPCPVLQDGRDARHDGRR